MPGKKTTPTAAQVAERLRDEFESKGYLHQQEAVYIIESEFGSEFVYENENGNPAIDRRVLRAFRGLTEATAAWDRWDKSWQRKVPGQEGRQIE
jgi:hypothetical protein